MTDFIKTTWADNASPDITAAQLNRIEDGVDLAHSELHAHEAASDPHTQYQKESEKGAAGGYAGLDGTGKVPLAQLPGIASTPSSWIDASSAGAVGDDSTDNTAVLQTALDTLAARGGGTLYLPNKGEMSGVDPSIYRSNGLWVSGRTRILSDGAILRCTGDSPEARRNVYGSPRTTSAAIAFSEQDNAGYSQEAPFRAGVIGLVILMNASLNGVYVNGGEQIWIENCVIKNGTTNLFDGIAIDARDVGTGTGEQYSKQVFIRNNVVDGCLRNGITVISGEDIVIQGNIIKNVVGSAGNPCCGIELEPDFPAPGATTVYHVFRRVTITGNTLVQTDGPGIAIVADPNNSPMGAGRCADIAIVGNTLRDCSTPHTYSTISGGIYISGGDGDGSVVISGNTVRGGLVSGAAVQGYPFGLDGHAEVRLQTLVVGNNIFSASFPYYSTVAQPKLRSNMAVADAG